GLATIDEIADGYGISRNHLMQVVSRLGQLGYLTTVRGKNGGMRLARDPARITVGTVVRFTGAGRSLVEWWQAVGGRRRTEPACVGRHLLGEAPQAFLSGRGDRTLADRLEPRAELPARWRVAPRGDLAHVPAPEVSL